jgi:hypothetical protein
MLPIELRKTLNQYYSEKNPNFSTICTEDHLYRINGRGLTHLDALSLFKLYSEEAVAKYIDELSDYLFFFYDARKYFKRNAQANEVDHPKSNPSGWAGPGLLAIAVGLKSIFDDGRRGVFVSCGCYKGGSVVGLSRVFKDLGIRQYAADTFSGLPFGSDDGYYEPGQFKGTLPEVRCHMEAIGEPGTTTYLEGLFGDTLHQIEEPVLACFLDTDLYESSTSALEGMEDSVRNGALVYSDGIRQNRWRTGKFEAHVGEETAIADFASKNGLALNATHTGYGGMGLFTMSSEPHDLLYSRSFVKALFVQLISRRLKVIDDYFYNDVLTPSVAGRLIDPPHTEDPIVEMAADLVRSISYKVLG